MNVTIWYEYKAEASVCNPTHNQNIYSIYYHIVLHHRIFTKE